MNKQTQTLDKQLLSKQKEVEKLQEQIKKRNEANKPKDITDRVKTLADVFKIAKPTKEELVVLNYKGKSKRLLFAKHMMVLSIISEVLNEGYEFSMKPNEERWYVWFDISSGFVFDDAGYGGTSACAASASRLCLKNQKLAKHAGTIFIQYYKNAIMMK